jgi:hypothetical protein
MYCPVAPANDDWNVAFATHTHVPGSQPREHVQVTTTWLVLWLTKPVRERANTTNTSLLSNHARVQQSYHWPQCGVLHRSSTGDNADTAADEALCPSGRHRHSAHVALRQRPPVVECGDMQAGIGRKRVGWIPTRILSAEVCLCFSSHASHPGFKKKNQPCGTHSQLAWYIRSKYRFFYSCHWKLVRIC